MPSLFNTQLILLTPGSGNPILLLNSLITGVVTFGLARAAWNPALKDGDIMKKKQEKGTTPLSHTITWTEETVRRIEMAPSFVKKIIEKRARDMDFETITPEVLDQLKGLCEGMPPGRSVSTPTEEEA